MKQLLIVAALLLSIAPPARAQSSRGASSNGIYLELLGNGGAYSINYDRALTEDVRVRIGYGGWTAPDLWGGPDTSMQTIPVTLHLLRGRSRHQLEIGGGVLAGRRTQEGSFGGERESFASLIGVLGYRYQRAERGFLFRAGFTPFYGVGDDTAAYPEQGFFPSFGVSFGYGF